MHEFDHLLKPRSAKIKQSAGFWRRSAAFIIDLLILDIFITWPLTPLFANAMVRAQNAGALALQLTQREVGAAIALFLLAFCYFVVFEYVLAQTPGMMLMGIVVHSKDSLWQMLLRNLFVLPFFPFILLWVIEPIMLFMRGRTLLEELSQTRTLHPREVIF